MTSQYHLQKIVTEIHLVKLKVIRMSRNMTISASSLTDVSALCVNVEICGHVKFSQLS